MNNTVNVPFWVGCFHTAVNAAEWPLNTVRTLLGRVNAAEWPLNTLRTLLGRVNSETFHERLMMGRVNTETLIMRTLWIHCLTFWKTLRAH